MSFNKAPADIKTGELHFAKTYREFQNLIQNLIDNGYDENLIDSYIEPKAFHNETAWRYAFNYMIYKIHQKLKK